MPIPRWSEPLLANVGEADGFRKQRTPPVAKLSATMAILF
jgi:hypothetical protein